MNQREDPESLLEAWEGLRATLPPDLQNPDTARFLFYTGALAMWRILMTPERRPDFSALQSEIVAFTNEVLLRAVQFMPVPKEQERPQ